METTIFGKTPGGSLAHLYTITGGGVTAKVSDFGATLVQLWVPDKHGDLADVVLGYDTAEEYADHDGCLGATVGRNANRIHNAAFPLAGRSVQLTATEGPNNLHSGPGFYFKRMWQVEEYNEHTICFHLESPSGDQGFPGNADIHVRYALTPEATLVITYDGICDRPTVFNMTNHSYFNMAGHERSELCMDQELTMAARHFLPDDAASIPTGELRSVVGTPMDFRTPKSIGRDLNEEYDALLLQHGYDHNFEVFCNPAAILKDPHSGRTMAVTTDCPGIQLYSGNFLDVMGKNGVHYPKHGGVALETQYYPDSVNHPEWKQPIFQAGEPYHSVTAYHFYN